MRYRLLLIRIISVFVTFAANPWQPAMAQLGTLPTDSKFELANSVDLDRADGAVLAQLERVKVFIADRKWDDTVDTLHRIMEISPGKLLGVTESRFISVRDYCQLQLASLPPDALKLYRTHVDPAARKWYEEGLAKHDQNLLRNIIDQTFASSWGDDALLALGDMALEVADYASARWYWERILPHTTPAGVPCAWPGFPDSNIDPATVRARLVFASILEADAARAGKELNQFTHLHSEAHGRLAGREVNYAEA